MIIMDKIELACWIYRMARKAVKSDFITYALIDFIKHDNSIRLVLVNNADVDVHYMTLDTLLWLLLLEAELEVK